MKSHKLSFFETVLAFFDKAAAFTSYPQGLLDQIKNCNSIYQFKFPLLCFHLAVPAHIAKMLEN